MITRHRDSRVHIYTEVEIDADELRDAGYHHKDDCPGTSAVTLPRKTLDMAIDDLHRQAGHGDYPARVCAVEPCRSLYLVPAGDVFQRGAA